ncbi:MAG: lipoate--protein ligase family protein [Elusimicrobiota bacterium]
MFPSDRIAFGGEKCSPGQAGILAWRLREDGALSGGENMAADEVLLEEQKDPRAEPVLRFFRWARPTVSFGRLQRVDERAGAGADVVRRPTGGGMVRHDADLSFSLAWRRDHPGFPKCLKDVYRSIHGAARVGLAELGIEAAFYAGGTAADAAGICFDEPAADDLMWKGKKILGGALRVTSWGRLYQGNLLAKALSREAADLVKPLSEAFQKDFFKSSPAGPAY